MRYPSFGAALALLTLGVMSAQAQTRTMAGRVTDALTQDPLAGGVVEARGLGIKSEILPDGVFVLHIPIDVVENVTLVVRALGYRTGTARVSPYRETVFIALERDLLELEAVVVSGQATAAEAITVDQSQRPPAASVSQLLQGRAAGVDIQQNSGVPGADLMVMLRGVTTILGSTSPLYVLDGIIISDAAIPGGLGAVTGGQPPVPSRVVDLNPHDIESIQILRGTAGATLYGSRGSNGVVIIKTKRGG